MGFLERHIEKAKNIRKQAALLEFLECVYGDLNRIEDNKDICCLIKEDFIDNIEDIDAISKETVDADEGKTASLSFAVSTGAGRDKNIFKTEDVDVVGMETIINKVKKFVQTSRFLGDELILSMKIYASESLMRNLGRVDLETFAEVLPLTPQNAKNCLKDEVEVCKKDTEEDNNPDFKGISVAFRIQFAPVRVTYKQLLREVRSLGDLVEEIMLRLNELSYVKYANISYKFIEDKKVQTIYSASGRDHRMPSSPNILINQWHIFDMGKYFFGNKQDTLWDSEDVQKKYDNAKAIHNEVVQKWMSQMIYLMQEDDVFKWQIIGYQEDERTDGLMVVKVMNVSQRKKNTVNEIRKHFSEVLNNLNTRNKLRLKYDIHELFVIFVYEGSSKYRDRLPKNGLYEGLIDFKEMEVHYFIADDSNSYRVFHSDKKNDVEKDGFKVFMREVNDCMRYQPVEMMAKEEKEKEN